MQPGISASRLLLFLAICVPWQNLSAATVNFAPLLFYESSAGEHELSLAGPFLEFTSGFSAFRPLYYSDENETDLLYPLGRFTSERRRFIPLFIRADEEDREHVNALLFFSGRYEDERYGGFFPLYGTFSHRFGYDRIRFVLWPLYSETTNSGIDAYSVLWPVFRYSPGREFQIFPLYGYEKTLNYRHDFALWPFIHFRRGAQHINAVLPFFYHSSGDTYWNIAVLWPLFTYSRDTSPELTSANFPWPLLRTASGAYEELKIFPFYWSRTQGDAYRMKIILWPLYKHDVSFSPDAGVREERTTVLLFNRKSTRVSQGDADSEQLTVWPLWHRHVHDDRTLWYFPWIIPIHDDGFRRNWLPLLTLASGETSPELSEVSVLWRTFLYRNSDSCSSFSLSFLFSYERCPGYRRVGFFSDLIRWGWTAP